MDLKLLHELHVSEEDFNIDTLSLNEITNLSNKSTIRKYNELEGSLILIDEKYSRNLVTQDDTTMVHKTIGCFSNGDLMGFIKIRSAEYKDTIFIEGIVVDRKYQRKGIGKYLLDHIIKTANADKLNVLLVVHEDNKDAMKLYRALGFDTFKRAMLLTPN